MANLLEWNSLQVSHCSCHLEHVPWLSKVHPVKIFLTKDLKLQLYFICGVLSKNYESNQLPILALGASLRLVEGGPAKADFEPHVHCALSST